MLLSRSHCRLSISISAKADAAGQRPASLQSTLDPLDANAEIAVTAKPMSIDPPPNPLTSDNGDHSSHRYGFAYLFSSHFCEYEWTDILDIV